MTVVGLLLASLAAVAFGTGTFIQHMTAVAVEGAEDHRPTRLGLVRLLADLAPRPRLPLEALRARRRPGWRLVLGLVFCVTGLAVFLLFSTASAPRREPGIGSASAAAIAFGSGTFVQHLCARSTELPSAHRRRRGLLHLLLTLVTQPRWLAGQALGGAAPGSRPPRWPSHPSSSCSR